jgi:site-specific recombinase XerD
MAVSCTECFAWGVLPSRRCTACASFRQLHPEEGECAGCRRVVPSKKGYCRLCWFQASTDAKGVWTPTLLPYLDGVRHHQLFFAKMQRQKARKDEPRLGKRGRQLRKPGSEPVPPPSIPSWTQLAMFDTRRDFTAFDRRHHADLTNPWLIHAQHTARTIGEARGWTNWVTSDVDRALVILLSGHVQGDRIRYSEMFPALRARGLSVGRTAEVLGRLGLLDDDRRPPFEFWLDRKLDGLTPGIRRDVESWLRTLHDGGPRTRARAEGTVWAYLNEIQPLLLSWSERYGHLREVTRQDILTAADDLRGSKRRHALSALRSLFRHCKKTSAIFRDPAARVRIGRHDYGAVVPLQPQEINDTIAAAATPAVRVAIALAAVHAARPRAIRELRLDDVDLGNRRLTIGGRTRPLDEFTHRVILDWLNHRRARWPNTANPHLIINQHTALNARTISSVWITDSLRGQTATLERLRVDRQLDEALTRGPDPLHLAAVFGLDDNTAIRYAAAARQILTSSAERHANE